jgi:hypothetical protein
MYTNGGVSGDEGPCCAKRKGIEQSRIDAGGRHSINHFARRHKERRASAVSRVEPAGFARIYVSTSWENNMATPATAPPGAENGCGVALPRRIHRPRCGDNAVLIPVTKDGAPDNSRAALPW